MMCAIGIKTTGDDVFFHEMVQLSIIPLNWDLTPNQKVMPFDAYIRPSYPERNVNLKQEYLTHVVNTGVSNVYAFDALDAWFQRLPIVPNKYGTANRIMSLGFNIAMTKMFLIKLCGLENYNLIFHSQLRDPACAALLVNDREATRNNVVPYPKVDLSYLASQCKIGMDRAHSAIHDASVAAEVYRRIIQSGCPL
jgi:hypothetical protein